MKARFPKLVLSTMLLLACDQEAPPPPADASPSPMVAAWTMNKCLDKASEIGVMLHNRGADDDAVTEQLQKAEDRGCDIRSPEFDRAMQEGVERAERTEECEQLRETSLEAEQNGDLVTARQARREAVRLCS